MKPIRMEGDVAVFSTRDVDDYGFPEIYGYDKYIIIESRGNFVTDYKMEHEYDLRPIHRYSRIARFKSTLFQLLGDRGAVEPQAYVMVQSYLNPASKNLWNDTRKILKHYKMRHCYNRIPKILEKLGHGRLYNPITCEQIDNIVNDFLSLSTKFDYSKQKLARSYFPSIRFIALKLLELHQITPNYKVPFVRTERKSKALNEVWDTLVSI